MLQLFSLGGLFIWWAIDLVLIVFGGFKSAFSPPTGQPLQASSQNQYSQSTAPASEEEWLFKTKPVSAFKLFLGANLFKSFQLDYAERKGDTVTVVVRSGKRVDLRYGAFNAKISKSTKTGGIRDFNIRSEKGIEPSQKIRFRECLWQMPEADWDELAQKLGAREGGLSKVMNMASNLPI